MDWRAVRFDWNRARAFLVTAEEGTFSAAARALGMAQPTLGRQVAALEEELGVALFERVGNALELTDAGLELVEHVRTMGDAAMRVSLAATGQSSALEGSVCITSSELIAAYLLPRVVAKLRVEHPGIEVEIVASNAARDLRRREADIAIRNFQPTQPELFAKRLGDRVARMYATPGYLERIGSPQRAEDLGGAEIFAFDRSTRMLDFLKQLGVPATRASFPVLTENHLVQWELCKQGVGICIVMDEVGDTEPRVRRVLESGVELPVPMWLTSHRELRSSRRIRVVFDLLARELEQAGA
ncbi:MAG: LysR family transcriptional regulator [Alphaproteobacteria bacterium]|nr:LysR family transcriptional regulator [Alphaproteobacteria bacterium]